MELGVSGLLGSNDVPSMKAEVEAGSEGGSDQRPVDRRVRTAADKQACELMEEKGWSSDLAQSKKLRVTSR